MEKAKANNRSAKLVKQARKYVKNFFTRKRAKRFPYHNFGHTKKVVKQAVKMAKFYQLSEDEVLILILAAWFHDVGYFIDPTNHEQQSAREAACFLGFKKFDPTAIEEIRNAILSTSMPQHPSTSLEEILCDADLSYLGKRTFKKRSQLLRKELITLGEANITKEVWRKNTITFLTGHSFFTSYAEDKLEKKKVHHLKQLLKKQESTGSELVTIKD